MSKELRQKFLKDIVNADLPSIEITLEEHPELLNQKETLQCDFPFAPSEFFLIHAVQFIQFSLYKEGKFPVNHNPNFQKFIAPHLKNLIQMALSTLDGQIYQIQTTAQYEEVIKCLIKHGAKPDCLGSVGNTALQMAASSCSDRIIQLMLSTKPDMNGEKNPLKNIFLSNNPISARLLIDAGASVFCTENNGNSLIFNAVLFSCPEIVELLVKKEIPIDVIGEDGNTPCMLAANPKIGNLEIFKKLLPANPDLTIKNKQGKTVYDLIRERPDSDEFLTAIQTEKKEPDTKYSTYTLS